MSYMYKTQKISELIAHTYRDPILQSESLIPIVAGTISQGPNDGHKFEFHEYEPSP